MTKLDIKNYFIDRSLGSEYQTTNPSNFNFFEWCFFNSRPFSIATYGCCCFSK